MKKEYDFSKGKRGPVVKTPPGKTRITIRLDDDVLEWFRAQVHEAGGGNYQTLINNDALREYMSSEKESLEDTLRRVLREELPASPVRSKKESTMVDDRSGAERTRTEGAKMILAFCREAANEVGIDLRNVYWATDIVAAHEQYILTIIADTGLTEIRMSGEEIEDYPGVGTEKTDAKIRAALQEIE